MITIEKIWKRYVRQNANDGNPILGIKKSLTCADFINFLIEISYLHIQYESSIENGHMTNQILTLSLILYFRGGVNVVTIHVNFGCCFYIVCTAVVYNEKQLISIYDFAKCTSIARTYSHMHQFMKSNWFSRRFRAKFVKLSNFSINSAKIYPIGSTRHTFLAGRPPSLSITRVTIQGQSWQKSYTSVFIPLSLDIFKLTALLTYSGYFGIKSYNRLYRIMT